jgi:hypothetical protein
MYYLDLKFNGDFSLEKELDVEAKLYFEDKAIDVSIIMGTGLFIQGFYSSIKETYLAYSVLCWLLKKIRNHFKYVYNDNTKVSLLAIGQDEVKNQAGLFLHYINMGFVPEKYDNIELYKSLKDVPKNKLTIEMIRPFVKNEFEASIYLSILLEGEIIFNSTLGNLLANCENNKNVKTKSLLFCKDEKVPIKNIIINNQKFTYPDKLSEEIFNFLSC